MAYSVTAGCVEGTGRGRLLASSDEVDPSRLSETHVETHHHDEPNDATPGCELTVATVDKDINYNITCKQI